jgi:hypothetical protein
VPVQISYIREEDRLDLTFLGNVDITIAQDVCDICRQLRPYLAVCIIDLAHADRLFDSGVALLQLLHCYMTDMGLTVVILADSPEMRARIAEITRRPRHPVPLRYDRVPRCGWAEHPETPAPFQPQAAGSPA